MPTPRDLAQLIAPDEALGARARAEADLELAADSRAVDLAVLVSAAYPALGASLAGHTADVLTVARSGLRPRDTRAFLRLALSSVGDLSRGDAVRAELRRFAFREKLRVAARELLHDPSADVDVTSRELADLADACIEIALREATVESERRYGVPIVAGTSARCALTVLGMGKLGGRELNAGSDVDLLVLYETDDGHVEKDGAPVEMTLHEYFTRLAQRTIANIEEATEDGVVWRVDMRLRPEGSRGPLVNSLAAAERYYETWGRTWERAALLRARPCAGDIVFGRRALDAIAPFVWRRVVNPRLADEMISLVARARAEAGGQAARDLKIGVGGIREAEFFTQSLQLIWGGREPKLRTTGTLDALRRLRAAGLVTDREASEVGDAYLFLRRLEHRVQFATGLQTHAVPEDPELVARIARSLGFASAEALLAALEGVRGRVRACLAGITTHEGDNEAARAATERLLSAVEAGDEAAVARELPERFGDLGLRAPDLARHLVALGRRPDAPLGLLSRELHPDLPFALLDALADAADPEQAARLTAAFFQRFITPGVYVRALAEDRRALLRLTGLFGASAFLGEAAVAHPELVDNMMFGSGRPDEAGARRAVAEEIATLPADADADELVGALRRAKRRVTMEVGLADLAGELDTRGATFVLSALADAFLEEATRFAMAERGLHEGLAVIGMGKLGGRELGYGSDLDLFFVYDPSAFQGDPDAAEERFVRTAQRVLRLASAPHGEGPGYELDTRLRPSGNQGLLVVSIEAFARYHEPSSGPSANAEDWERQALLKARAVAGDAKLGRAVVAIAERAAYERGAPPAERIHHLRMRMERELSGERTHGGRARYDVKLGRGGVVDVEFAVQWLQMKHGRDPRVRSADTETALGALEACGYLDAQTAASLREGYRALRQIEQRLRVHHGTSATLLEEGAPGLDLLARRLGLRDSPRATAAQALLARHVAMAREVRAAYLRVISPSGSLPPLEG